MVEKFLKKYWLRIFPWFTTVVLLTLLVIVLNRPKYVSPPPPVDNRIDSLQQIVNQLHTDLLDARHDYDSAQSNIKTDIVTIRIQNAKDVSNISNFSTKQLDSAWTTITFP
jgi:hypothetical protein